MKDRYTFHLTVVTSLMTIVLAIAIGGIGVHINIVSMAFIYALGAFIAYGCAKIEEDEENDDDN